MTEEQKAYHRKWYAEHKAEVNKRYNAMYQRKKRQISERRKELRGTVRRKISRLDRPVIITGTSSGIGLATAKKFLEQGFTVIGIDIQSSEITLDTATTRATNKYPCRSYIHHIADVSKPQTLPDIKNGAIVINTVPEGYSNIAKKYAFQPNIRCVVDVSSLENLQEESILYTCDLAVQLSKYKATVNSIIYGTTDQADKTLLNKCLELEEVAEWIYFLATVNKSATGQAIFIDNGQLAKGGIDESSNHRNK